MHKKKKEKASIKASTVAPGRNTLHVGAANSYCTIRLFASSQHVINVETNHATQHPCRRVQREKTEAHSLLSKPDLNEHFGDLLPPLVRCIIQSKKFFQDEQQTARLNFWERRAVLWWPTTQDSILCPGILPSGTLLVRQLSGMSIFSPLTGTGSQEDTTVRSPTHSELILLARKIEFESCK